MAIKLTSKKSAAPKNEFEEHIPSANSLEEAFIKGKAVLKVKHSDGSVSEAKLTDFKPSYHGKMVGFDEKASTPVKKVTTPHGHAIMAELKKLEYQPDPDKFPPIKKLAEHKVVAVQAKGGAVWVGLDGSPDGIEVPVGQNFPFYGMIIHNPGDGTLIVMEEDPAGPQYTSKITKIPVQPAPKGLLPSLMEEVVMSTNKELDQAVDDDFLAQLTAEPTQHKAPGVTGKVTTETTKQQKGELVTTKKDDDVTMEAKPIPAGLLHNVNVHAQMTLALENYGGLKYENVKIGVSLTVPCTKDTLNDAYDFAKNWVSDKMDAATKEVKGEK